MSWTHFLSYKPPFAVSCMPKAMRARGLRDYYSANTAAGPAARFELRDPLCVGTRFALGPALRWGARYAAVPSCVS